jgi:hypothetical protein
MQPSHSDSNRGIEADAGVHLTSSGRSSRLSLPLGVAGRRSISALANMQLALVTTTQPHHEDRAGHRYQQGGRCRDSDVAIGAFLRESDTRIADER